MNRPTRRTRGVGQPGVRHPGRHPGRRVRRHRPAGSIDRLLRGAVVGRRGRHRAGRRSPGAARGRRVRRGRARHGVVAAAERRGSLPGLLPDRGAGERGRSADGRRPVADIRGGSRRARGLPLGPRPAAAAAGSGDRCVEPVRQHARSASRAGPRPRPGAGGRRDDRHPAGAGDPTQRGAQRAAAVRAEQSRHHRAGQGRPGAVRRPDPGRCFRASYAASPAAAISRSATWHGGSSRRSSTSPSVLAPGNVQPRGPR